MASRSPINNVIEKYGEAARAGICLEVIQEDASRMSIRLRATPAALVFLGNFVSGFLGEEDECHFSLQPFGAGLAYFQRTHNSNPGLYLHQQPCEYAISIFPEGRGIGWLCFAAHFDNVPEDEREYDPSYIAIEGDTNALLWFKGAFHKAASGGRSLTFSADELQEVLGFVPFNLEIIPTESLAVSPPD